MHFPGHGTLYVCEAMSASLKEQSEEAFIFEQPTHKQEDEHCEDEYETDICAYIASIADNAALYSKRDVLAARDARILMETLMHPSSGVMQRALNKGMSGAKVTAADVRRADKIFGPSAAALRGKMPRQKPTLIPQDDLHKIMERRTAVLHADIMFVEGEAYLATISVPMMYLVCTHLTNRSASQLHKALSAHLAFYNSYDVAIDTLICDNERGVASMTVWAQSQNPGVRVVQVGAGAHVPLIEVCIRRIKERLRATLTSLPFSCAKRFLKHLVQFATYCINILPSTSVPTDIPPYEILTGRKVDIKRDCRLAPFQYVHAPAEDTPDRNRVVKPRSVGCIALRPVGLGTGTYLFLVLRTGEFIRRSAQSVTVLPMNDLVVDIMSRYHAADPIAGTSPTVARTTKENLILDDVDPDVVAAASDLPETAPATAGMSMPLLRQGTVGAPASILTDAVVVREPLPLQGPPRIPITTLAHAPTTAATLAPLTAPTAVDVAQTLGNEESVAHGESDTVNVHSEVDMCANTRPLVHHEEEVSEVSDTV